MWWIVLLAVIAVIVIFIVSNYNVLVALRNAVKDQWAQIDVQLKKRTDLIPNIVETVKGYAGHEKSTFTDVVEARNKTISAKTPEEEMKANGELTGALNRLFALAESYPELKANTNFLDLQNTLKDVEEQISYARQFYNDSVLKYKNKLEMFPSNIVAGMFSFKSEPFFETSEADKEVPKVKF